ncbi:MAG: phage tail terminator protein [Plesiomonas sp.]|uniref:phage tail terminator protein n=1 Tax=Plesiomonas sp. TaxID=2486279 RepID=UPI003F2D27E9
MQISPIIAALRTRCEIFNGRVAGASEFKPLPESSSMTVPAAYVMPLDDNPDDNCSQTDYWQELTDGFAVVVLLPNTADERGQHAVDSVDACRKALWSALLGWKPSAEYDGIVYEGGTLLAMDRARLYYQFEFSAKTEINDRNTYQFTELNALPEFDSADAHGETDGKMWGVDYIDPGNGPDGHIEHEFQIKPE